MTKEQATTSGISSGCALAMILSYSINQSIGYAILHGFLSWIYVLYIWIEQVG